MDAVAWYEPQNPEVDLSNLRVLVAEDNRVNQLVEQSRYAAN
jgi:hypothetical protein